MSYRTHKLYFLLIIFTGLALSLTSCTNYEPRIHTINDASRETDFVLNKKRDQGYVDGISLKITGKINGKAKLVILNYGKTVRKYNLAGDIKKEVFTDWYSDNAKFLYQPEPGTQGEIEIEYVFSSG